MGGVSTAAQGNDGFKVKGRGDVGAAKAIREVSVGPVAARGAGFIGVDEHAVRGYAGSRLDNSSLIAGFLT